MVVLNAGQNYFIRGGSDQCLFALERLLQDNGHRVIPFAVSSPRNLPSKWSHYFPQRVNFKKPKFLDLIRYMYSCPAKKALQKLLQDVDVDIAHLHIYYGQLTTSILGPLRKAGIPIVQTLHEYKIICPVYTLYSNGQICQACNGHAFWMATLKRCNRGSLPRSALSTVESYVSKAFGSIRKFDQFIAVSDFLREKVIELGVPAEKVTTVHNFLDPSNIFPKAKPGKYFLYVGRLERVKGIFTLIEAASTLGDIPLLIVGDGSVRSELKRIIVERGLDHIHLLGFKRGSEMKRLMEDSICVIAPSEWYETFGLVLVEAFAHGKPVIASRIGGMTEVVTPDQDGFLVPPGDADTLREKMIWMANNRDLAVDMGMEGRQKVEEQFAPEIYYQKIMNVYQKVM